MQYPEVKDQCQNLVILGWKICSVTNIYLFQQPVQKYIYHIYYKYFLSLY